MNYIRLSRNYSNNTLVPANEDIQKHITNREEPWFVSMLEYNQAQYEQYLETGSLAGLSGSRTTKLWWDFDSDLLDESLEDTRRLYLRLEKLGIKENEAQIAFSGNKGFSVIVDTTEYRLAKEVKSICSELAKDLVTFDKKIYDNQRIFRMVFTRHEKSRLFKIPLTKHELFNLSIGEIVTEAKSIEQYDIPGVISYYKPTAVTFHVPKQEDKKVEVKELVVSGVDFSEKPDAWRNCKWSLLQGHFSPGERHNALMVIAATCKALKYDRTSAYYMCKGAADKQSQRTGQEKFPKDELYKNIIDSVFNPLWVGGQYSCREEGWLQDYCKALGPNACDHSKDKIAPVITIDRVDQDFTSFVQNIEQNTIKTGLAELDEALMLTTGMMLGVLGAPSSGKTALALDILKNTSENNVISVFASLDMHRNRMFEKLLYKVTEGKLTREEIYQMYKDGRGKELTDLVRQSYKNVYIYDRSAACVPDLRKYILDVEEQTGQKVKLLMVDYFERVNSEKSDDTAASKDVAGQLQDLVNDLNLCGVVLLQPNKMALNSGPDKPLMSYHNIKGSAFVFQALRAIISIWRPFFTPDTQDRDRFLQMAILKNDLGSLKTLNFSWVGKTGSILPMSQEEEDSLEFYLKEKKEEAEGSKKDGGWD